MKLEASDLVTKRTLALLYNKLSAAGKEWGIDRFNYAVTQLNLYAPGTAAALPTLVGL